jgi:hypothetical protein
VVQDRDSSLLIDPTANQLINAIKRSGLGISRRKAQLVKRYCYRAVARLYESHSSGRQITQTSINRPLALRCHLHKPGEHDCAAPALRREALQTEDRVNVSRRHLVARPAESDGRGSARV